ncbi:MAG TPA: ABC transporter permease [Tenuifilaceae bacterium]|nr:ABC transporter permease [Tenuifilaceae bacterium]
MGFIQAYKMAIKSIRSNKVRSFLTMLGVIIGVSSVITAVAFAQGSTKKVIDTISSMGTNLIQVSITGRNSNRNVTYNQIKEFSEENSVDIAAVAPQSNSTATVKYKTKNRDTTVLGTSPDYQTIRSVGAYIGRFLVQNDLDSMQRVAIIGTAVVNDIFEGTNPIGQKIKINGQLFSVAGVLEEKDGGQDNGADDMVIIPVTVAQRLFRSGTIRNYAIQAKSPETVDSAMEKINEFLTKIYKNPDAYRVFNQAEMLENLDNMTGTMTTVLAGIAAISLVVGGIGIMNIMLVSVTERTKEIGIRKVTGASSGQVVTMLVWMFAKMVALSIIIAWPIAWYVTQRWMENFYTPAGHSITLYLLAAGMAMAIAVLTVLFQAINAANTNPATVLKAE